MFTSCGKNNDDTKPGQEEEKWLVAGWKEIYVEEKDTATVTLTYNQDGTIGEMAQYIINTDGSPYVYQHKFSYASGKLMKVLEKETGETSDEPWIEPVYQGDVIAKVKHFSYSQTGPGNSLSNYDSLVYVQGKITEMHVLRADATPSYMYRVTWEGDNVKTVELGNKNPDGSFSGDNITTFTYDAKPALARSLQAGWLWLRETSSFELLSANNVVKRRVMLQNQELEQDTREYVYNDRGQVSEVKITATYGRQSQPDVKKMTVEYVKQ